MTTDQPQPGDIWERDGERREVVTSRIMWVRFSRHGVEWDMLIAAWLEWQSGAKLVERKDTTQ